MSPRTRRLAFCLLLVCGAVAWWWSRPAQEAGQAMGRVVATGAQPGLAQGPGRPAPAAPGSAPAAGPTAVPPAGGQGRAEDAFLALVARGEPAAVQAAAAALRARLRAEPAALVAALERLLDPALSSVQRQALALVLGTLERAGVDAGLLAALARLADDEAFARCALLALGATREPDEDDEVFDLGDRPWGQEGPAGLGITVERRIADAQVLEAVAPWLQAGATGAREAAAVALRHSLDDTASRLAFVAALQDEAEDDVALHLAEGLVAWLRQAPPGDEGLVAAVLARAVVPGFDGMRLRLEDDLEAVPFSPVVDDILAGLCATSQQVEVRRFAHTVLARHAARSRHEAEQAAARVRLLDLLRSDPDAALRDLAASLLRRLPGTEPAVAGLRDAYGREQAWQVRHAIVDTLGSWLPLEAARAALGGMQSDADPRVAGRAQGALRDGR